MKIKWNGHASFTITAADGTVLVTDPYNRDAYEGALLYAPVDDRADGVLVSHDHPDHNHVAALGGAPVVLKGSGTVKNIAVTGVATYHDTAAGAERGANTIFVFTVDGVRICFAGDLGHQLSAEQLQAIGTVDLLLLPVGGTYTVDAASAVLVAEAVAPKVVIPMHFKTEKCRFPITGVDDFLGRMRRVKRLEKSEVEVTAADLPTGGIEVWVLHHAR
ncbi:MBL fold metallo-hydrolase [Desulfatitalea alkaliphila]|uniref:MBL fold metallo-hydrolase n=1 Tax=Desulfatitalea alkaliphila TaxID=2929485 RepID=A0AA41UIS2_9BACT|nr:MBL fold metallo-hydrolase [Desulfatitalea alkaliphila]MCJ8501075.1 MBL fold metallo-hydrolase [Desulfatitalea alkaliphila]